MSLKLEEIMVKDVITVESKATVLEAVELMNKKEVGCLIAVEGRKHVGIVTKRDILKRVIPKPEEPGKMEVSEIMSKPLLFGNPRMGISEAVGIMLKQKIKKLPVVEHGILVGSVTLTDLLRSTNIVKWLEELLIEKTSRGIKEVINTYFAVERLGKKCPLIVEQGYLKRCRESQCMWWLRDECVIIKLSRQISEIKKFTR